MVLVIVSMMVLTLVAGTALTYAMTSQKQARRDQDTNGALAAAQAGVEDYISQLNRNDDYARAWDCTNVAQRGPAAAGNTCGWTASTGPGWLPVAGQTGAQFHYDIDPTKLDQNGTVRVTSTGKANGVTRTLDVAVGRGGSTDFLYYTTYEHADPANRTAYTTPPSSTWCSGVDSNNIPVQQIYWWSGRSSANAGCAEIQFIGGDTLDGRVHVNDTPLINGATNFLQGLETSNTACKAAVAGNASTYSQCQRGSGTPVYGVAPVWAEELYLADNSSQFAGFPGCQYTGPTRIVLRNDGKMNVWSKWSTAATAECGGTSVTTPTGALGVAVPEGKVIYVQNGGEARQCTTGEIGDSLPLAGDVTMQLADQYCNQGNLYVEGTLSGRVSIAASNSVILTGDLLLNNGIDGNDMLGIVAGNSVQAFHPWIATTTTSGNCLRYNWTPSQDVALATPNPAPGSGQRAGWQDGYFNDPQNPTSWTPGQWVYKTTGSQQYRGDRYNNNGDLVAGGWTNRSNGDRYQPGTWTLTGGAFSFSNGQWTSNNPSDKYYRGQQWTRGSCTQYQNQTTTYAEAPGWPHRTGGRTADIQIYGSIQTLQHSFYVQNYNKGSTQGKLTVWGSIAQKWRGIVGTQNYPCSPVCGYYKDYRYDKRLKYSSPPYFPQWSGAQWGSRYTGEIPARYRS